MGNLGTRIAKLEKTRRPAGAAFFLAWGATMEEAEAAVAHALQRGAISGDDVVVPAVWTGAGPIPPSRWVRQGGVTEAEFEVLMPALERVARSGPNGRQSGADGVLSIDFGTAALSDETLVGMALGRIAA
jgi:hypothetical protein